MDRVVCPYCYHTLVLSEHPPAVTVKCPACQHFVDTDTPLPAFFTDSRRNEPIHSESCPVTSPGTVLTRSYLCGRCQADITTPTGLRRSTILCPGCGSKTSLYSILYWCPSSKHLLESPLRTVGQRAACPLCQRQCMVPQELVVRRRMPVHESRWYAFHCPCCHADLETGREHAGKLTVCPECLQCLEVPYAGEALAPTPIDVATVPSTQSRRLRTCSTCRLRIPIQSRQCPYCQARRVWAGYSRSL